ncbi:hypothetical protein [Geomonas diazotrophica]|nr:hypothetical protein [Geomonas nitrogeniifigens]
MITYNVIAVSDIQEFNWAFTLVVAWLPALFGIKAIVRLATRS